MDQPPELDAMLRPATEGRPARRLNGFALAARDRLRRNLKAAPPTDANSAESSPAPGGVRAEAALLVAAILDLRSDLDGALSVLSAPRPLATLLDADLLDEIDRLAEERLGSRGDRARAAVLNAIVREWLAATEQTAGPGPAR